MQFCALEVEDIPELKRLADITDSNRIKRLLIDNVHNLEATMPKARVKSEFKDSQCIPKKQIKNYAWEQTNSAIKIYVPIDDSFDESGVNVNLQERSLTLNVSATRYNYELKLLRLGGSILTDNYSTKIKNKEIVLTLKKSSSGDWQGICATENKKKEDDFKPMDKNEDPQLGLMNLMRKMYDEGDDDMKRTINKAWAEANDKKMKGIDPTAI